jgi:hypothetical protein
MGGLTTIGQRCVGLLLLGSEEEIGEDSETRVLDGGDRGEDLLLM